MSRKAFSGQEYEPLITPDGWKGDELRFSIRLTQILDGLFARLRTLRTELTGKLGRGEAAADSAKLGGTDAAEYALKSEIASGCVMTINDIAADEDGGVQLDAADVGARPDDWTPTAADVGALDAGGTAVNAERLGGVAAAEYALKDEAGAVEEIKSLTAAEFEALTTEGKAALYASGVRVVAVDSDLNPDSMTDMQRFADFAYPVGCIVELTVSTDPVTLWGIGEWESYLPGRVLVGAGTADSGTVYTAWETGGYETHLLTIPEMPIHDHLFCTTGAILSAPASVPTEHGLTEATYRNDGSSYMWSIGTGTADTGGSQPHNIMQPYGVVYRWRRTA